MILSEICFPSPCFSIRLRETRRCLFLFRQVKPTLEFKSESLNEPTTVAKSNEQSEEFALDIHA